VPGGRLAADVIAVQGDMVESVAALRQVRFVMTQGRVRRGGD
jgi:hypothetical protein